MALLEHMHVGRIVHFVLPTGTNAGAHRPAIVVAIVDEDTAALNLCVFPDTLTDGILWQVSAIHQNNVPFSGIGNETKANGYWHEIEGEEQG